MKFTILTAAILLLNSNGAEVDNLLLTGPYVGQSTPGDVAELFAPKIVSTEQYSYGGVFTPSMNEFYYLSRESADSRPDFVLIERKGGVWRKRIVSKAMGQPSFSPDGSIMHLGKRYKSFASGLWSDVKLLGPEFQQHQIMRMTSSRSGTFVFDQAGWPNGDGVVHYSTLIDGERQSPIPFSANINSGKFNAHPFIAPDESYLIWDSHRENGFGDSDIYIAFKQDDGSFGDAINMGPSINSEGWDAAASVTPDGLFLFFHRLNDSSNANIYWISANIIDRLRLSQIPD